MPAKPVLSSRFCACLLGLGVALITQVAWAEVQPLSPQPQPDQLKPGLAVDYYYGFYRHIDNLVHKMKKGGGEAGQPLPMLNYRVGPDKVLTSDRDDGVGAHIHGLIHLEEAGTYAFAVESNDGVRLSVGGKELIEDPDVHPDQWSNVKTVDVQTPGWYRLEILYFERKNTSTLRLVWRKPTAPESEQLSLVPESAYAHLVRD